MVIHQTLYTMFPPSVMDPELVAPLTPQEFIQRVLVPEAAVYMIMEDLHEDYREAVKTLRESSKYGVAMFPDNNSTSAAGEKIVMERARVRRREIEEEEAATEVEMDASDASGTLARKGKGKGKRKEREKATESGSDAGRGTRKSKRMKTPPDVEFSTGEEGVLEETRKTDISVPRTKPRPRPRPIRATTSVDTIDLCASGSESDVAVRPQTPRKEGKRISDRQAKVPTADNSSDSDGPRLVPARAASKTPSVLSHAWDEKATPKPRRTTRQAGRARDLGGPPSSTSTISSPRGKRLNNTTVTGSFRYGSTHIAQTSDDEAAF